MLQRFRKLPRTCNTKPGSREPRAKVWDPCSSLLKKGEATTARPHRELSAEVRALARTKVWLKTWKGSLRLEDVPALTFKEQVARDQLRECARQQAAALPPVTASLLKTKFGKGRVTAPGPDGWSKIHSEENLQIPCLRTLLICIARSKVSFDCPSSLC